MHHLAPTSDTTIINAPLVATQETLTTAHRLLERNSSGRSYLIILLKAVAEPRQLEEEKVDELKVFELTSDRRHHLQERLDPQSQNALVAVCLGEWLS